MRNALEYFLLVVLIFFAVTQVSKIMFDGEAKVMNKVNSQLEMIK